MVGTDSYHRNDDGSYGSSSGQSVSQAPNGDLYVGGVSSGYRDIGFGVQPVPMWERFDAPGYRPPVPSAPVSAAATPGWPGPVAGVAGGLPAAAPAQPTPFRLRDLLVPAMVPVYVWQLVVAALTYVVMSSSLNTPLSLHLHPAWGVAAAAAAVWAYLRLARFWPIGLMLAFVSSGVAYLLVWGLVSNAQTRRASALLERFDWGQLGSRAAWERLASILSPGVSAWTVAAVVVCVVAHAAFWTHHRLEAGERRARV